MGFLDQSTNNIILDAVLTDKGREFLSRNDGSFSIIKFALGDDEVDYNVIQQYGRTVGKEKVEKNTPVLEASTLGNVAIKYKLISASNGSLIKLPTLSLSSDVSTYASTTSLLTLTRSAGSGVTSSAGMTINQTVSGETVETELIDNLFKIEVNHLFLSIGGMSPDTVDVNNIATYTKVKESGTNTFGGATLLFNVNLKSFSDTVFNTYKAKGTSYIRTYITVTGLNSGAQKMFEVQITSQSS